MRLAAAVCMMLGLTSVAAAFEGVARRQTTLGEDPNPSTEELVYLGANGDVRIDEINVQPPTARLRKHGSPDVYLLDRGSKQAVHVVVAAVPAGTRPSADVRVERVGTEKIAGWNATHLRIRVHGAVVDDVWVTRELPADLATLAVCDQIVLGLAPAVRPNASDVASYRQALVEGGVVGFPLKERWPVGPTYMTKTVLSVEAKRLSPSWFDLPRDYKLVEPPKR